MIFSLMEDKEHSYFDFDESKYLCVVYRGSIAHNMYVPPSDPNTIDDVDLIGICFGPPRSYLGLEEFGSRGTEEHKKGKLDIVVYEIRKAISLMLKGNPNILSLLWNRNNMIKFKSGDFMELLKMRDIFSSKQVGVAFSGYAYAQLQKMETRDPADLRLYLAVTKEMKLRGIHPNMVGQSEKFDRVSGEDHNVANWDSDKLRSSYRSFVKKGENLGYMGDKRKQLVLENGYDSKNAAHCIRLLKMGIEFLNTGVLEVWREKDRDELLYIKKGKWPLSQVKEYSETLFKQLEEAQESTKLPDEPDYEKAWSWCEGALRKHLSLT